MAFISLTRISNKMKVLAYILILLLTASNAFAQGSRRIQSSDVTGALGYTPLQSVGAMTGPAIACGSGISCSANTISSAVSPGGSSGQIQYNNAGSFGAFTLSGDATANTSTGVLTLSTVNANVGSFGSSTQCTAFTTNAKGLITAASQTACTPAIASVTGLGTGVATALAINTGSVGAFITNGGAAGTPASITLTNATGLVPSTGVAATGTPSATTFLRGDNTWSAPAGSGTVTTTGTPANGNLTKFSGASSITNGDLSGDITTSGTLATTYAGVVPAAKGGAGTITGALKANGAGVVSQAACADLSNGTSSCSTDTTNASNISSGTLATARGGVPQGAWTAFSPSPSCGTATFTSTARWQQIAPKTTAVEYDITVTAIGTCTSASTSLNINLPNTAQSGASSATYDFAGAATVLCWIPSSSTTMNCRSMFGTGANALSNGSHFLLSTIYENQ